MDTIPLLRLLGSVLAQTLSRGEVLRQGITETMIIDAQKKQHIVITSTDNTRNGEASSLASLMLTDSGEQALDAND
jgi:hypothetical protein